MKPDEKYFSILRSPDEFPNWWKGTYTVCLATGMDPCINFAYAPQPGDPDWPDFYRRNRWFYYILYKVVQTSEGRRILDDHATTADGRAVLMELYYKTMNSGASGITSTTRMDELIQMRIEKGYAKPYVTFINNFVKKGKEYNDLQTDPASRFSDGFLMQLLKNAVSTVPQLAEIHARERKDQANGMSPYDFTKYLMLLKDEAERLDGLRRKARRDRDVNMIEQSSAEESTAEDNALIQAFKAMIQRNRRNESSPGWMDAKIFSQLTPEAKSTWNKIPEDDRDAIIKGLRQVNYSHITDDGGESNKSEDFENSSSDRGDDNSDEADDRKINVTETSDGENATDKAHPGNIARVMGQKTAKTPSTKRVASVARWNINSAARGESDQINQDDAEKATIDWPITGYAMDDLWKEEKFVDHSSDEDFH